jgi:hypothetical protein
METQSSTGGQDPTAEELVPSQKEIEQEQAEDKSSGPLNPYQPEDLWIDLSKVHAAAAVNRPITTIPIRRPNKHEFFRTNPEEKFWRPVAFVEFERSLYLVHPATVRHLDNGDIFYAIFCLAISKSGELFFWPLKESKGSPNMWNESALKIAKIAIDKWVKIRSRQEDGKGSGYYEAEIPIADFGEPVWPDLTLKQLYDIALKGDRIIDRIDHLVIQKLKGQVK